MTIQTGSKILASDFNTQFDSIVSKLKTYDVRRQALKIDSVWNNTTPNPPSTQGATPTPIYYGDGTTTPSIPTVYASSGNKITSSIMSNYTSQMSAFCTRMVNSSFTDPSSGIGIRTDFSGKIATDTFNNLTTLLTRALSILSGYDYYTKYESGGSCKRSCQTVCQSTCQLACQSYSTCHNQRCGGF